MHRKLLLPLAVMALRATAASAQTGQPNGSGVRPSDFVSPASISTALYESISGPAGPRDWERFHSLFDSSARMVQAGNRFQPNAPRSWTPADYAREMGANWNTLPFYEKEVSRHEDRFGQIAQVFSTYESRRSPTDSVPFARGVNTIQFRFAGNRWSIISIAWDAERSENRLPPELGRKQP